MGDATSQIPSGMLLAGLLLPQRAGRGRFALALEPAHQNEENVMSKFPAMQIVLSVLATLIASTTLMSAATSMMA
jgi:hypothetical protein